MKKKNDENGIDFDEMAFFEREVRPELNRIVQLCTEKKIPFFFSCAPKNVKGKTTYVEDGVLTGSFDIELYQDYFTKFLLVRRLNLVPAAKLTEFNEESLGADAMEYINDVDLDDIDEMDVE